MKSEVIAWVFGATAWTFAIMFGLAALRYKRMLRESLQNQVESLKRRWALETEVARMKGIGAIDAENTLEKRTAALNDLLARLK